MWSHVCCRVETRSSGMSDFTVMLSQDGTLPASGLQRQPKVSQTRVSSFQFEELGHALPAGVREAYSSAIETCRRWLSKGGTMTASPKSVPVRRYAAFSLLLAFGASCTDRNLPLEPTPTKPPSDLQAAAQSPRVTGNSLVDLDHGQLSPENKQNEPAITRDPLTGTLIARANDEVAEP